jgi:hypothetical protein
MDMTNSFFQTHVHPDDIHLTAVRNPWGLYEWTVMPMGGCNAPSTHQCRITVALRELISKICHVYLNDIIIWSQMVKEHEVNVAKVLDALRAANLFCNGTKTTLFSAEISFLRHKISGAGIQADLKKIDQILDWPKPTTSTNVRGFLELTRYLATFLPALAEHTGVLTPLTTKECDQEFPTWMSEHQKAFEAIKQLVTGAECLTVIDYDDTSKKIFVMMDASDRQTGAVLSFGETWETARPVAYNSYQLNNAEKNYPVHEKELLAIIKALKSGAQVSWEHTLKFSLITAPLNTSNLRKTCHDGRCIGPCILPILIMASHTSEGKIILQLMHFLTCQMQPQAHGLPHVLWHTPDPHLTNKQWHLLHWTSQLMNPCSGTSFQDTKMTIS